MEPQQNVSIQHKSSIRKTVAVGPTTSIRADLWVVKMLPPSFSVPQFSFPLLSSPLLLPLPSTHLVSESSSRWGDRCQHFQLDQLTDMHPLFPILLVCEWFARAEERGEGNSMRTVTLTKHLCFHDEATRTG